MHKLLEEYPSFMINKFVVSDTKCWSMIKHSIVGLKIWHFPHSLNNYAKWNPSYISFDPLVSEIDTLSPLQSIETCWRPLFFHGNFRVFNIDSPFFVFINS